MEPSTAPLPRILFMDGKVQFIHDELLLTIGLTLYKAIPFAKRESSAMQCLQTLAHDKEYASRDPIFYLIESAYLHDSLHKLLNLQLTFRIHLILDNQGDDKAIAGSELTGHSQLTHAVASRVDHC